jgi:hypothetical protein
MHRARIASSSFLPAALALASLAQADEPAPAPAAPPGGRNFVAVVVGVSTYQNLPKEVHLDFARSDAATVAQALRDQAPFSHVFLLRDGEATRESVRDTLRTKAAQVVGPNDVFVLYFVGHGLGGDLEMPTLLTADSTMANGQQDGLELQELARDLQTWTRAGTSLIVTDVIHRNQLDGIYFYGPAANQWPSLPAGTMVLSASAAATPAKDGAFGPIFAQGIGGAADSDRNGFVSASEIVAYLHDRLDSTGQVPVVHGEYNPAMELTDRVAGAPAVVAPKEPETKWPDFQVQAAKFVWYDGSSQEVQCREQAITTCAPSCYVRDFKAGPCDISAVVDGVRMKGQVVVVQPGKYECARRGGDLVCSGP